MSEEQQAGENTTDNGGSEQGSTKQRMEDGIKQGLGVLTAFKDALEETIQEARDRGDLSTDRAKEVMKDTLEKAQSAAGEARDRLDFVSQGDLDAAVEAVRERVSALEEKVFGAAKSDSAGESDSGTDGSDDGTQ